MFLKFIIIFSAICLKIIFATPSCDQVNPFCACDMVERIRYIKCPKINVSNVTSLYTHYIQIIDDYQVEIDCVAFNSLSDLPNLFMEKSTIVRVIFKKCFSNETDHANYQFRFGNFMTNTLDVLGWNSITIIFEDLGKVNETLFFENCMLLPAPIRRKVKLENIFFDTATYLACIQATQHVQLINTNLVDFDKLSTPNAITTTLEILNTKMVRNVNRENLNKIINLVKLSIENSEIHNYYDGFSKKGDIFQGFPELRIISLRSTFNEYTEKIELNKNLFGNLTLVYSITLEDLKLEELPLGIFNDLTALRYLVMRHNRLTNLEPNIFKNCPDLYWLELSYNNFVRIPDTTFLSDLHSLGYLQFSFNQLATFEFNAFSNEDLREILLDHNRIEIDSGSCPITTNGLEFEIIDYSFNQISNGQAIIDCLIKNQNLRLLNVSHNEIQSLEFGNRTILPDTSVLDLANNGLEYINFLDYDIIGKTVAQTGRLVLLVDSNPVFCSNCNNINRIFTLENIQFSPNRHNSVKIMHPKICDTLIFCPIEQLIDLCPPKCVCLYQDNSNALLVNCKSAQLRTIPNLGNGLLLGNRTKEIHLNFKNNLIKKLSFGDLTSFELIDKVVDINLENNLIENLNFGKKNFPIGLKNLQLQGNRILTIDETTLELMNSRESLLSVALANNSISKNSLLYHQYFGRIKFTVSDLDAIDDDLKRVYLTSQLRDQQSHSISVVVVSIIFILTAFGLLGIAYVSRTNNKNSEICLDEIQEGQSLHLVLIDNCNDLM